MKADQICVIIVSVITTLQSRIAFSHTMGDVRGSDICTINHGLAVTK